MDLPPRLPLLVAATVALLAGAIDPALPRRLIGLRFRSIPGRDAAAWRNAALVLLVAALLLVTLSAGNYGYNVDEWYQSFHGIAIANWYSDLLSGGGYRPFDVNSDFARTAGALADVGAEAGSWIEALNYYGGSFELTAELASRLSPLDRTATRHLVTAWVGILGLVGAYLLGRALHSRAAGFGTVVLLLATPRFYGHFFNNPKDLPFAVCTVFSLLLICRSLPLLPRLPRWRLLALGVALGLGLGVRAGGIVTFFYLAMALAWWLGRELLRRRGRLAFADFRALAVGVAGIVGTAWLVMLLFWPWALRFPVSALFRALRYYGELAAHQIDFHVRFEGRDTLMSEIPRRFTLEFFLVSMPEFALLAPIVLVVAVRWMRGRSWAWPAPGTMAWLLVGTSVALPLATTASRSVAQYDATRHFLFVMPSMALMLAAALVSALDGPAAPRIKVALLTAAVSLGLVTAWDMGSLHPYEYVYFNRGVAGGLSAASRRFDTDYLGLSYREGVRLADRNFPRSAGRPTRITSCPGFHPNLVDALASDERAGERFVAVQPWEASEIAVATTRDRCNEQFQGQVVASVERNGVPLLQVIRP